MSVTPTKPLDTLLPFIRKNCDAAEYHEEITSSHAAVEPGHFPSSTGIGRRLGWHHKDCSELREAMMLPSTTSQQLEGADETQNHLTGSGISRGREKAPQVLRKYIGGKTNPR